MARWTLLWRGVNWLCLSTQVASPVISSTSHHCRCFDRHSTGCSFISSGANGSGKLGRTSDGLFWYFSPLFWAQLARAVFPMPSSYPSPFVPAVFESFPVLVV